MRVRSGLFVLYAVCAVVGIFWLPLHVPMKPSGSISYMLGFNNRAALFALATGLAVGCIFFRGFVPETQEPKVWGRVPNRLLLRTLLLTTVFCGCMALVASPTWNMDESTYLLGRVQLILSGFKPYVDFEYIYGPLLLYAPAWGSLLLHLNAGPAYFLVWWLEWMAGTSMLAWIVGEVGFPATRTRVAFLLLWSVFLSSLINTGETYTPFRELAAPAAILVVHRMLSTSRLWGAFALAVLCASLLLLISPELAIAFLVATSAYVVLCGVARPPLWRMPAFSGGLASMLVGFGLLLKAASRLHEFDSAKQFSSGGSDIPLLLTPVTLLVVAGLFVGAVCGVQRVLAKDIPHPRVALVVLGVTLLPGMMGRADPSHLILYGLSILIVALVVFSSASEQGWQLVTFLFVLLFTAPLIAQKMLIDFLSFFDAGGRLLYPHGTVEPNTFGARLDAAVSRRWGPQAEMSLRREVAIADPDPHASYQEASPLLMAPFGYVVRGRQKPVRPDVALGYFDGTIDVMSSPQVQQKLSELAFHPDRDLLLPSGFSKGTGCIEDPVWAVGLLRLNFGYSYLTEQKHTPRLLDPLCQFIDDQYRLIGLPSKDAPQYELWRRKRVATSVQP